MTQQTKSDTDNVPTWPFAFPNMPDLWRVQSPPWFEGQAEQLEEIRGMVAAWAKRRQDGVAAYVKLIQDLGSCRDFGAVTTAYGEWWDGAMKRVTADLNDARDETLRLAEIGQKSATAFSPTGAKAVKQDNGAHHRVAAE
jgi:hypothetical protein